MSEYFDNKGLFMNPKTTQYGSHMVMTDVFKESKKKLLNIDTKFRDEYNYLNNSNVSSNLNYQNVANYNITLPETYTNVKHVSVSSIEIPVSYYNISANLGNNCFKITNLTTNVFKIVLVPDGQYTASGLQSTIASLIATLNGSFAGVSNVSFTLTANGSTVIAESNTGSPPNYLIEFNTDSVGAFDKYNFKFKLGWMLGFRNPSYTIKPTGSITSEAVLDLTGSRYLYLVLDEFSHGNQSSFVAPMAVSLIKKNILARISTDPVNVPYGAVLFGSLCNGRLITDCRSYTGKTDIQRLNVQLVNENGVPVNLNGLDFSFCMELEHE
jgi:hypothetical protein